MPTRQQTPTHHPPLPTALGPLLQQPRGAGLHASQLPLLHPLQQEQLPQQLPALAPMTNPALSGPTLSSSQLLGLWRMRHAHRHRRQLQFTVHMVPSHSTTDITEGIVIHQRTSRCMQCQNLLQNLQLAGMLCTQGILEQGL